MSFSFLTLKIDIIVTELVARVIINFACEIKTRSLITIEFCIWVWFSVNHFCLLLLYTRTSCEYLALSPYWKILRATPMLKTSFKLTNTLYVRISSSSFSRTINYCLCFEISYIIKCLPELNSTESSWIMWPIL